MNLLFKSAQNKYKIIVKNPIQNIDTPKDKSKTEKTALTNKELNDLLSKINNRKYYMISLIASKAGLRLGEILGLTWNDIDDKKCLIDVNKQWKMLKDGKYGFGDLKSSNSKRIVPISPNIIRELIKYKKEFPLNINNRLFNNICNNNTDRKLSVLYRKLGYDISIHELRHTYATILISNEVDFKTAARLLGHDVEQTIKTYSHVTDDMLSNASKIINNIFK